MAGRDACPTSAPAALGSRPARGAYPWRVPRPRVVITEPLDPEAVAWLAARCEVIEASIDDEAALDDALRTADALIVRTYTRVDEALLARAPRLRVVGRAGVGLDNVDVDACRARGVVVVFTPEANTSAVVEYIWSQILGAVRPIEALDRALSLDEWRGARDTSLAARELSELTLGILGMGRIGRAVARVGATLMGRVIYHDLVEIEPGERAGATPVDREALLAESDILTIHVDGRAANRGLIGAAECALLKRGVVVLNASRGFVVQPAALAAFLRERRDALAILDVHDPEPFSGDYPLLGLPNARLHPHIAAGTVRAKKNMSRVVEQVWGALAEETGEVHHRGAEGAEEREGKMGDGRGREGKRRVG